MATHDYNLANADGATFRADLNSALSAIVSQNSSASEPSTTFAYQFWADTTNDLLKQRNAANSGWITLYTLSTGDAASNTVPTAAIEDNAITLAKMAGGTDGELITYDASGNPATVAVGTSGQVLTSNGAGAAPTMQAAADNTPACMAYASTGQTISNATFTKVQLDAEVVDTDSDFDSSTNYRFTPSEAGYYAVGGLISVNDMGASDVVIINIKKNSTVIVDAYDDKAVGSPGMVGGSTVAYMNGSTDYFEMYVYHNYGSNRNLIGAVDNNYLFAYKLAGVS